MSEKPEPTQQRNPYRLERDQELETFAQAVIDEAMGKTATSPRQFAYYSAQAAKLIAQYVLERFTRKKVV
ncbi:MAG TPA: hypothetical protein VGQ96_01975 [Candidatus Eremiobacteraceae bacterium]|nr:hypothetical protein [Candidatus Eremiobacteraceae bacterium]